MFCKYIDIKYVKKDIFQTFNIFICQDHEFLYNNWSLHQLHNHFYQKKSCKHFYIINAEKLCKIECFLQEKGIEAYTIIWE